jgi:hexosaminidase
VSGSETTVLVPRPRRARFEGRARVEIRGGDEGREDARVRDGAQRRREPALPPQGYRLTIGHDGALRIDAADDAGLFYAEATLAQLRAAGGDGTVPVGQIEDWPDLPVRGVMLDVSRTKVPTLETLLALVDRISSWKLNHLQLYVEHSFAYPGHEEVWRKADPLTAADMEKLQARCTERHVELVANQNTLGHMERWLLHPRYAPLGVARGVVSGPLGLPVCASTLDPARPGSLELVRELLGVLAHTVPGERLHVGLDEPWDLPAVRSAEWGTWLGRLRALPETAGRELLVWGDMPAAHPELLASIGEGVTVCEWGYEADHPFDARLERLARAGVSRWVCPGTSSWLSLVGRATNAVDNCRAAARAAAGGTAGALVVTDWGDFGHLQPLAVSDPGLAAAAAFSWCLETNAGLDAASLARCLDRHGFADGAGELGGALMSLGDAYRLLPRQLPNVSLLALHLYFPQLAAGEALHGPLSAQHLDAVDGVVEEALGALHRARPATAHGRLAVEETALAARLVQHCVDDLRARLAGDGTLASIPPAGRAELRRRLEELVAEHRRCWLARNRAGGLEESCAWLEHLGRCYGSGEAPGDWAGPLVERLRERQRELGW